MKPNIKNKMEQAMYWARYEACVEKGDKKNADKWLKKFEEAHK